MLHKVRYHNACINNCAFFLFYNLNKAVFTFKQNRLLYSLPLEIKTGT